MLNRNFSLAILVCVAAGAAAFGQANQGQEYLFQFFSQPTSSTLFTGYTDTSNLSLPLVSTNGPAGIAAILPTPAGGFYLVGTTGTNSLQAVDPTFTNFTTINGLGAQPNAAAVTPDGKYLLVAADAFYIVDATTNTMLTPGGLQMGGMANFNASDVQGTCITCWIAVSGDSQTAFVLTNSPFSSTLTEYNLATRTRVGSLNLGSEATSVTMSPLGMLYVTVEFNIYVINPANFIVSTSQNIPLNFEGSVLRFTPDGTTAYTVNRLTQGGGGSMAQINLATGTVAYWPPISPTTPTQFADIFVAGNNRVFAYAPALNQLLDITTSPFQAEPVTSLSLATNVVQNEILAVALSNELPQANWLFLLIANGNQTDLYRVNLTTNALDSNTLSTFNSGVFETTFVPAQSGATSFLQYNNSQNLANGGTSNPLLVTVLNATGIPVFGQPVTFTTDPSNGLVINNPTPTTNARGSVSTTVSVPTAGATCPQGVCTITVMAGSATTTFTVTVPTSSTTGPGGPTSSQVQIISGDGQLLPAGTGLGGSGSVADPLVVLVTDTNGQPLAGVPVTFSVSAGPGATPLTTEFIGAVDNNAAVATNSSGLASVNFISEGLPQGSGYQTTIVTATTSVGSANFTIVEWVQDFGGGGVPDVQLITPTAGIPLQVTAGTPVVGGIQAQIRSTSQSISVGTPIQGVGVVIVDSENPTNDPSGPQLVGCQGSSDSNAQGVASCTVVAKTCQSTSRGVQIFVGNFFEFDRIVQVNPGGASTIAISSGNNQTGQTGTTAAAPLVVQVTDACGNPVAGVQITWKVTSGSATIPTSNIITSPSGQASASVAFGATAGPITVTATLAGGGSVTFKLTGAVTVAAINLVSGGGQTATIGQPFAQPLVFVVTDKGGNPLAGVQVNFSVQSGSASVTPVGIATDSAGHAQTVVTAGSNSAGPIVIQATANGLTATASLTSAPIGPSITPASFQNAASFAAGLTPCGLGIVTGNGLAPGVSTVIPGPTFGPLGFSLGPVTSMTVNLISVPISAVSNENGVQQINFQTPCEVQPGPATVVITINGVPTTIPNVQVLASQPGIFTFAGPNGIQYGAVIRAADGTYVTPSSLANRGELYYIVVTGLGQTSPLASTDNPGNGQTVVAPVIAGVNNSGVGTGAATYAKGLIGVYLVPFQIPLTANTGLNQPLSVATINGQTPTYSNSVFIPGVK